MEQQSIYGNAFLSLSMTLARGELAFNKMLIKDYLRSMMSQDRLNGLAMLSIECQLAQKLDIKAIINDFATRTFWHLNMQHQQ